MAAAKQIASMNVVPVMELPVEDMSAEVPGPLEDLEEIDPSTAANAVSLFANFVSAFEGSLGAGPSEVGG